MVGPLLQAEGRCSSGPAGVSSDVKDYCKCLRSSLRSMFSEDGGWRSRVQLQNIQPTLQLVHHVHDAVFVHVDVVDAVGVGALGDPGDVVGDFLGLEGVGGVGDVDGAVETCTICARLD